MMIMQMIEMNTYVTITTFISTLISSLSPDEIFPDEVSEKCYVILKEERFFDIF